MPPLEISSAEMQISDKISAIDEWLPQTQCTQCSYPRCLDYAKAIATGEAAINQCPPGGDITINGLANLLDVEAKPLDTLTANINQKKSPLLMKQSALVASCV